MSGGIEELEERDVMIQEEIIKVWKGVGS